MALYILNPELFNRKPQCQAGGALLLTVMLLFTLALSAIAFSGQQVLQHFRHYSLDAQRVVQQIEIEAAFDSLAAPYRPPGGGIIVWRAMYANNAPVMPGKSTGDSALLSSIMPVACPLEDSATACFVASVQHSGGLIRERMLVVPEPVCGSPYWYIPASRVRSNASGVRTTEGSKY